MPLSSEINKAFFDADTLEVARALLGVTLTYNDCSGMIVETEAYKEDAASHAVTRPNKGAMLRETYGCVYIYFIYGMYHCLNFTTEKNGVGAVLVRAIEPIYGMEKMLERRGVDRIYNLTNGPGKLFNALGVAPEHHGEPVGQSIHLQNNGPANFKIKVSPRIGVSKAVDLPWRFFIDGNAFVSRK